MIKRFLIVALMLFSVLGATAQEGSPSPYSFFGLGSYKFEGTVENRSMGGISVYSDSIHVNLQNPAAYGGLKLTAYTIAGSHKAVNLKNATGKDKVTNSTLLEYLAVGLPAGKWGFGFGLIPFTSVGYHLKDVGESLTSKYSGSGGLNRVFVSAGYQLTKNLKIGATANYNFGNIQHKSLILQDQVQFGTQEINRSNLSGFSFNFGLQYQKMISESLQLTGSTSYSLASDISSENTRRLATVVVNSEGQEIISDLRNIDVANTNLTLPSLFKIGAGIGAPNKWFMGVEYGMSEAGDFSNHSNMPNVNYTSSSKYALGGFYVPNYNDISSYFNRIVYRAGFRYEETGLNINNQAINEFGISFGVGLPLGKQFSNLNIGFEYGQRGTTEANLIKENFYGVFISLSLNDLWFQKTKYN